MANYLDQVSGFYRLSREERLARVQQFCGLEEDEMDLLSGKTVLSPDIAENFIENVLGYFPVPFGVATHFRIDDRDLLIPMVVEETSIIAAASAAAKWVRNEGFITTASKGRLIIGQIQFPDVKDVPRTVKILQDSKERLIELANQRVPNLVNRGGGIQDVTVRSFENFDQPDKKMVVLHVLCDPCDAMGANLINQVCEALKPHVEVLTGERVGMCILSNLMDGRLARAEVVIRNIDPKLGDGIVEATEFARSDPYRATTHNKGTLNGIDPVLIATGNDWRAVEAGIHAYAARTGKYLPVTHWEVKDGDLKGMIEVPLAVGTVGGVTRGHPMARIALKILGVEHADDLARICAAVGLVQNLAAVKALSTVGIIEGHMKLHTSNLAIAAGAELHEVAAVSKALNQALLRKKTIGLTQAKEILQTVRQTVRSEARL